MVQMHLGLCVASLLFAFILYGGSITRNIRADVQLYLSTSQCSEGLRCGKVGKIYSDSDISDRLGSTSVLQYLYAVYISGVRKA